MQLVIGLGGAGMQAAAYMQAFNTVSSIKFLYINNDKRALQGKEQDEQALIPKPAKLAGNSVQALDADSELISRISGYDKCVVICGLGGSCGDALKSLLFLSLGLTGEVHLISYLPFSFENQSLLAAIKQKQWIQPELKKLRSYRFFQLDVKQTQYSELSLEAMFQSIAKDTTQYVLAVVEGSS